MNKIIIAIIVLVLVGIGGYFLLGENTTDVKDVDVVKVGINSELDNNTGIVEDNSTEDTPPVFGTSIEGREIEMYTYGNGDTELLFVGGIHGGYSWNTSLVAYEFVDYLTENASVIPENVKVTIIPVLNPDGLYKVIGKEGRFEISDVPEDVDTVAGRFNARNVDLNRNFDCGWKETGTWQKKEVSGGAEAFSEPESEALRTYVEANNPTAVVVWYSAAGGVYASNCFSGVSDETSNLTSVYAEASGYTAYEEFDFYEVTGDATNWLARIGVPAISVLLTTHDSVEWDKNKKGIDALLKYYAR